MIPASLMIRRTPVIPEIRIAQMAKGMKNTSGNGDNSQEQALIDDIRAKEEAVNEAMLSRRRELQSAEQAIRDTQIGDASDSTLENTQAELETAQKDLETLQKVLARKGKVKAPCDGVIKSLSAVTGSQTGAEAAVVLYESKGTISVSGRGQQR